MKVNHKPHTSKNPKGMHQMTIPDTTKTYKEFKKEITDLEEQRYRLFIRLQIDLQEIELQYKKNQSSEEFTDTKDKNNSININYYKKRINAVATFNEQVRPIDRQLKILRISIIKKYPTSFKKIDRRLQ